MDVFLFFIFCDGSKGKEGPFKTKVAWHGMGSGDSIGALVGERVAGIG